MKRALILSSHDSTGWRLCTRYGVEDSKERIDQALEDLAAKAHAAYVTIDGTCFVHKFHHEEDKK